eukprot:3270544-Rhodomonas_salina.1
MECCVFGRHPAASVAKRRDTEVQRISLLSFITDHAARLAMYSEKDSPWGMCVCFDFGSFGSIWVGVGLRECAKVSVPQPDGGRSPAFWAGAPA